MRNPFMPCNITVVDSVMGKGKSTWAINEINRTPGENYIVVVPTLAEVERYKEGITRGAYVPNEDTESNLRLLQDRFREAAEANKTIVTTHRMLECWDEESIRILENRYYTLILDEVTELVKPAKAPKLPDYKLLIDTHKIKEVDYQEHVKHVLPGDNDDYYSPGKERLMFSDFMEAVRRENMYKVNRVVSGAKYV
jgi:hypothetical protein